MLAHLFGGEAGPRGEAPCVDGVTPCIDAWGEQGSVVEGHSTCNGLRRIKSGRRRFLRRWLVECQGNVRWDGTGHGWEGTGKLNRPDTLVARTVEKYLAVQKNLYRCRGENGLTAMITQLAE